MGEKIYCKVETDKDKINHTGLRFILEPLIYLNKTNYIFEAKIDKQYIRIKLPDFLQDPSGSREWVSYYKETKERIEGSYTFVIIEDKQLEFDF